MNPSTRRSLKKLAVNVFDSRIKAAWSNVSNGRLDQSDAATEKTEARVSALLTPAEDPLRFVVALALRKVRGLRKQVTGVQEDVMAGKLIDELNVAGYEIVKKESTAAGGARRFGRRLGPSTLRLRSQH